MSRRFAFAPKLIRTLFLVFPAILIPAAQKAQAVECPVVHGGPPGTAELALLAADYEKAENLYRAELARDPHNIEAEVGLVHALLHQDKVHEAEQSVNAANSAQPNAAALISIRGEVEYRNGTPWDAAKSANEAGKLDPCYPRNLLLVSKVARLSSLYATEKRAIDLAHKLDPDDPDITREWIYTLPRSQRVREIEAYLAKPEGLDPLTLGRMGRYLDQLHKVEADPHKSCHLVSSTTTTEIPFTPLMYGANRVRAFGLNAKLNDHTARLEIDTGAGGLLVSRSVAQHAGMKPLSQTQIGGIGDEGEKAGYTAYADSIRIGNLEFQDCLVEVLDVRRGLDDVDGLIGMNVFSQFLVTLDYPMRKLVLGPLPPRPGETANPSTNLDTEAVNSEGPKESEASQPPPQPSSSDGVAGVDHGLPADTVKSAAVTYVHGPYDRYIAPEMQGYTPV